jgi:protein-S-isoprenylcysteine O-methyltransferase Ste14
MTRILSALYLLLFSYGSAFAQAAPEVPEPTVSVWWVVVFGILFFGFCIGVGWLMWKNGRETPDTNEAAPKEARERADSLTHTPASAKR